MLDRNRITRVIMKIMTLLLHTQISQFNFTEHTHTYRDLLYCYYCFMEDRCELWDRVIQGIQGGGLLSCALRREKGCRGLQ